MRCLSDDQKAWGKKKICNNDFKRIFGSILKRCGPFLRHLIFEYREVDSAIVDLVRRECPHLQDIDITSHCYIRDKESVEMIKPIFCKIKKLNCWIWNEVMDGDLEELFSVNDKLEELNIENQSQHNLFHKICQVSHIYISFFYPFSSKITI